MQIWRHSDDYLWLKESYRPWNEEEPLLGVTYEFFATSKERDGYLVFEESEEARLLQLLEKITGGPDCIGRFLKILADKLTGEIHSYSHILRVCMVDENMCPRCGREKVRSGHQYYSMWWYTAGVM